jgi:hypothetical protein
VLPILEKPALTYAIVGATGFSPPVLKKQNRPAGVVSSGISTTMKLSKLKSSRI